MLGITEKSCSEPITKGADFEVYQTVAGTEVTLNKRQCEQRRRLVSQIKSRGFEAVVEEVAYTWFNRICAIRFMEVNDYLPNRVRVLSSEKEGKMEPDLVTQAPDVDLDLTAQEKEEIINWKLSGTTEDTDMLYRTLFLKECHELYKVLPGLFATDADYMELLFNISYTNRDGIVFYLINSSNKIAEEDWKESIEIIGWLYQYYISEKHDAIVNISNKEAVKKENIPAATQLFTTDWIVKYLVDNTLGKYWIERNPRSSLRTELDYFIETTVPCKSQFDNSIIPQKITFFDPCIGSGHFAIYAFDVFMKIYLENGYSSREAAAEIIQNNIYGLDIDDRASQLAYFSIMMKARQYDRRFFTRNIQPNIYAISESNDLDVYCKEYFCNSDEELKRMINYLEQKMVDAKEYGSLLEVNGIDFSMLYARINEIEEDINIWKDMTLAQFKPLIKAAELLSKKYTIVATNPPYLNKYNSSLKKFISDNYSDYSGDLFSAFIYRNLQFAISDGYCGYMTPFVWMYIKSYEKIRKYIIKNKGIVSLIQMEYSAYEEATVPLCAFILSNDADIAVGKYFDLSKFVGGMEVQKQKVLEAIRNPKCGYLYEYNKMNYERIEGTPIAFMASETLLQIFETAQPLKKIAEPKVGLQTGNNDAFLRLWFEVERERIGFDIKSLEEPKKLHYKWFPYNKGGEFKRWYGNRYYIVNWENDGYDIKHCFNQAGKLRSRPQNTAYYFRPCITWSDITSAQFSGRYCEGGFIFDVKGSSGFPDEDNILYVLGFLNSKISQKCIKMLNPTITTQVGDMARIPICFSMQHKDEIDSLVKECISIVKEDWDNFEISWEFKKHPLIRKHSSIKYAFELWKNECENRFSALKQKEERLNEIFLDIYGLQAEIDAKVDDRYVTVHKADLKREIRSLISYFIGCMFGRYSLNKEGIVYAGGKWNIKQAVDLKVDSDNIIPICDEEYFKDDIVNLLIDLIKDAYGEEYLEENLKFITNVLNGDGEPKSILREYFLNEFYRDHCNAYQITGSGKRPIYWLFDSGKQNGFKALIYMHRYDADTVGRVRTDYLHRAQKYVETAMQSAQYTIDNASSASEKSKATKAITKYTKQLAEMKIYDEAIAHIANKRIEIDLDDGVKVNYEKFQGVEVAQEGKKTLKVDLLAKIK